MLSQTQAPTQNQADRPPALDANGVVIAQPRPKWAQHLASAAVIGVFAWLVWTFATNDNVHWPVFAQYVFHPEILRGIGSTLELTLTSVVLAFVLGVALALMHIARNPVVHNFAIFYVWFMRGVPLIVQIVLWFNLALIFPKVGFGVPFTDWWWMWDTNEAVTPFMASILALSLHEAAYMAEIVRGGLLSVSHGQVEAALTIGMTPGEAARRIVLPQAIRVIIPPAGNQFIMLLKASALVSVIGGGDLLTKTQNLYSINYEVIALLFVATFWYMAIISVSSTLQSYLERRLSRSDKHGPARAPAPVEAEA